MSSKSVGRRGNALKSAIMRRAGKSSQFADSVVIDDRSPNALLQLTFLDSSVDDLSISLSSTAYDALLFIQAKYHISSIDSYGLFRLELAENTLDRDADAASLVSIRQIEPDETLENALVTSRGELATLLIQRVKLLSPSVSNNDLTQSSTDLADCLMRYKEALFSIFAGRYLLTEDEALKIGCWMLQIDEGCYQEQVHTSAWLLTALITRFPSPLSSHVRELITKSDTVSQSHLRSIVTRVVQTYRRMNGSEDTIRSMCSLLQYLQLVCPLFECITYTVRLIISSDEREIRSDSALLSLSINQDNLWFVNVEQQVAWKQPTDRLERFERLVNGQLALFFRQPSSAMKSNASSTEFQEMVDTTLRVVIEVDDSAVVEPLLTDILHPNSLSSVTGRISIADGSIGSACVPLSPPVIQFLSSSLFETLVPNFANAAVSLSEGGTDMNFVSTIDELISLSFLRPTNTSQTTDSQRLPSGVFDSDEEENSHRTTSINEDGFEFDETRSERPLSEKTKKSKMLSMKGFKKMLTFGKASKKEDELSKTRIDGKVEFTLLDGELLCWEVANDVNWSINLVKDFKEQMVFTGGVAVTNYRVILTSTVDPSTVPENQSAMTSFKIISIPIASICNMMKSTTRKDSLFLYCRDFRVVRISTFDDKAVRKELKHVLLGLLFPLLNATSKDLSAHMRAIQLSLFAYSFRGSYSSHAIAWELSNMKNEYHRQGLGRGDDMWKVVDNTNYDICSTYPPYFVVPLDATDDQLRAAAAHRSRNRLPVVTYRDSRTGAVLTRSSQPMVGLTQRKSDDDVRLLHMYRCKGGATSSADKFVVFDARGRVAATLNKAAGKGTEDISRMGNTELIFCNIENIHVMRSSVETLCELLAAHSVDPSSTLEEVLQQAAESTFPLAAKIEESGWLRHIRYILLSSMLIAEKIRVEGTSVLVHCSDGWDRTAQLCSIAQMLLDPYYRSIEGFAVLIEKDWCAFGHKFQDRCGAGQDESSHPDEKSPVFLQFLESVYQLLIQFPSQFEFTDSLLIFLAQHVVAGQFGNFVGNSDRERRLFFDVVNSTRSAWAHVLDHKAQFSNNLFSPSSQLLYVSVSFHRPKLWERFWLRWDVHSHPKQVSVENESSSYVEL